MKIGDIEMSNYAKVALKKSSSKDGKIGWDIEIKSDGSFDKQKLQDIAEDAMNVALKVKIALESEGGI